MDNEYQTFAEQDFSLEANVDLEEMEEVVENHEFPLLVFMCAVIKDMTDAGSFGLAFLITTPIFWFVWLSYMSGKGRFMNNMMGKWAMRRFIFTAVIEMTPVVSILPGASILVVMAHNKESKIVKALDETIEELYYGKQLSLRAIMQAAQT